MKLTIQNTYQPGIFSLTNEEQMPELMDFIEIHRPAQYLVYGCTLTALTAIKGLMDMGVPMNTVFWGHSEADDSTSWSHGNPILPIFPILLTLPTNYRQTTDKLTKHLPCPTYARPY